LFATLECAKFKTQVEARIAVFGFIEGWYNPRRRHSFLGYLSPNDFEKAHTEVVPVVRTKIPLR
jgi:putative transposase